MPPARNVTNNLEEVVIVMYMIKMVSAVIISRAWNYHELHACHSFPVDDIQTNGQSSSGGSEKVEDQITLEGA